MTRHSRSMDEATRQLEAQAVRHQVFLAAAGLFAERGYLGTSITDLVDRAGVTKNTLYSHFANKEALALALVEYTAAQWPPMISAFQALRGPAVDTVIALSFEVAERYRDDVAVRAGIRLSLERDTIKAPVPPPLHGWVDGIERILSPAGANELMGLSVNAGVAARVIVISLIGVQHVASGSPDYDEMARSLTEMWTVVLPGLRPTPDPAGRIAAAQALRARAHEVSAP